MTYQETRSVIGVAEFHILSGGASSAPHPDSGYYGINGFRSLGRQLGLKNGPPFDPVILLLKNDPKETIGAVFRDHVL